VSNTSGSSALTLSLTGDSVISLLFGTQAALTTCSTGSSNDCDRFYVKSLIDDGPPSVATPEPGTLFLLGSGLVGVAAFGRRLRKRG